METRGHGLVTVELLCNYCAREGCVSHVDEQQCTTPREQIRSKSKLKKNKKRGREKRKWLRELARSPLCLLIISTLFDDETIVFAIYCSLVVFFFLSFGDTRYIKPVIDQLVNCGFLCICGKFERKDEKMQIKYACAIIIIVNLIS